MRGDYGTYTYRVNYKLAYIKVVDMWNTTNVIAYVTGNSTVQVRADRPLGIAAVYVYSGTTVEAPPPPLSDDGTPPPEKCQGFVGVPVCTSNDVQGQITPTKTFERLEVSCTEGVPKNYRMDATFTTTNPRDCDAFIAPGPGTYTTDQVQPCDKEGNSIICRNVPRGRTIILDCDHRKQQ
jgi:hypothetical protein